MQGMSHGDGVDEDKMMKHDLRGEEQVRPRGNSMKTGKVDERVRGEGQVVLRHKVNGSLLLKWINGNCSYIKS